MKLAKNKGIVLVVDGSESTRKLVSLSLKQRNFKVLEAKNVAEGMEMALEYQPDIIISELIMPRVDGMDFCKRIRDNEVTRDVFFIIVTEFEDGDASLKGLEAGCDEYLRKPIVPAEIIMRVNTGIKLRRAKEQLTRKNNDLEKALKHLRAQREKNKEQIREAKKVQSALISHQTFPNYEGYTFDFIVEPSQVLGGDYANVIELREGKALLILADVSGHGISSALVTGMIHTWIQSYVDKSISVSKLLCELNQYLCSNTPPEIYVTAFVGVIDASSDILKYGLAGHPEPLLCEGDDHAIFCTEPKSPALGVYSDIRFDVLEVQMRPGATLYVYSDGLSELFSHNKNDGALREIFEAYNKMRDSVELRWIYQKALGYVRGRLGDDLSVLMIAREE
ncbi:MAG: fused response regulator/phosphatase [Deltaproteobacteria bacterium]|nr:fused response regulator/phosphatase [Deltaproteobacteria bacterium]MBW1928316.1 fused response regulator/phosphatase [Deltaproteobacteria bacterium]MBW2026850.1 fused response regulator/phosphatase [Deltaproteobacteria bacterium]MBW2126831.1 fused response regulator/phosphatase [Deltaproteobacteria bacterium]RLB24250.1 MAG: hypothetical protein DRG76_01950 [Deltaproteobacteria bacterium]